MTDAPKMTREMADKLRRQFPPEQVGKLPRKGISLDYVGHADVTSRLLEVDPEWDWEPLAYDERGLPAFDLSDNGKPVGLWIKLTVGGVTRLGYGSVPADQNDAVKVLIGDALRNAALRFGVALDLWAKGDRADPTMENPGGPAGSAVRRGAPRPPQPVRRSGPPVRLFQDAQDLVKQAYAATDPEEVRDLYKSAGTSGWLKQEAAHPETGEKKTVEEHLTSHGNDLKHAKSTVDPAGSIPGGGGGGE